MIIVVETILAFYWLVLLNFPVFVCQGSWILATSKTFWKMIMLREKRDIKPLLLKFGDTLTLPFVGFLWLLPKNPELSICPSYLPSHSSGLCSFLLSNIFIVIFFQYRSQFFVFIIWCVLLDHCRVINLNSGRALHKDDIDIITTISSPSNTVSVTAENYVSVVGSEIPFKHNEFFILVNCQFKFFKM